MEEAADGWMDRWRGELDGEDVYANTSRHTHAEVWPEKDFESEWSSRTLENKKEEEEKEVVVV